MTDEVENIFERVRELGDCSRALVTLATAAGALIIAFLLVKTTYHLITGIRLYVLSQFCCKVDYIERYGKWAVISGATDGIGLAMARELAGRGHSIVVIGRNEDKLAHTKLSLERQANSGEVVTVKIDLSDSSLENYGRIRNQIDPDNRDIGILINNAGIFPAKLQRFNNYDMEYLREIVNVDVLATVYLTRMIMPGMLERGKGLVVNVSSLLGSVTGNYLSLYAPSKAFVDSFSRQLQEEYSSHPVDIINLTPGPVITNQLRAAFSLSRPSSFSPTPESFSKTAINALATRVHSISGTIVHSLTGTMYVCFKSVGLNDFAMKMSHKLLANDFAPSPVMKRKNRPLLSSQAEPLAADRPGA